MKEMDRLRQILRLSTGPVRLFRNNVGRFWGGKAERFSRAGLVEVAPGDVLIRHAQLVDCGLVEGASDLVGWQAVTVTPDMVGQTVGVFVGIEVKTDTGRLRGAQRVFLDVARQAGCRVGVARSEDEARKILGDVG